MKLFNPLDLTRNTIAAVVILTSPTLPMPHPDEFGQLFAACLETRDPNSDECVRAQQASGLSPEDFLAKLTKKLEQSEPKVQPKPERRADLWSFMKECAVTRDVDSEACRRFLDGSGLSADEIARLVDKLAQQSVETSADNACRSMKASLNGKPAHGLMEQAEKVYAACAKAAR